MYNYVILWISKQNPNKQIKPTYHENIYIGKSPNLIK